jgi:hypothetical protein
MKTAREFSEECFDSEVPKFVGVLKAVPADKPGSSAARAIDDR